ncbi:unnamed protein product [Adineta ricciae]|uniref:Uncharacterized protein n=1 Tax=Adineta ricciae TaxID=249248 RepID=A0A814HBA1_ADIRI|nr:unnamed protein product [Adineta ricciae]
MIKPKKLVIRRSSDFAGGGFGFTIRHFVIYPPSVSVNDILRFFSPNQSIANLDTKKKLFFRSKKSIKRASYSVVIDEHQQKQLEGSSGGGGGGGTTNTTGTTSSIVSPSILSTSSSSGSRIHHQGEQQGSSSLSSSSSSPMKTVGTDNIQDDGTTVSTNPNPNLQSMDTIFVKEVRQDGPAYAAGLRQGDQILTVNDQSINGKTYSQVIALIQNIPTELILNIIPKEDDTRTIVNSSENLYQNLNSSRLKSLQYSRSSPYQSAPIMATNNTIEQKLRNLQINLAQGRTAEELAHVGIYFPPPTSTSAPSSSQQQNAFSNYIDSVHRALDSSKQQQQQSQPPPPPPPPPSQQQQQQQSTSQNKGDSSNLYYESPYHNDYIPHDYKRQPSFQINFNQPNEQRNYLTNIIRPPVPPRQNIPVLNPYVNTPSNRYDDWSRPTHFSSPVSTSLIESHEELKSPSTDSATTETRSQIASNEKSPLNDNDMKTEFVNFRKKQFETGHVENIVRDPQRESKTKKYSEKKKYENEWNRLTAVADVESVMERASHFEDIDPDKFARLKSKLPTSPPAHDNLNLQDNFHYDFNPNYLYDSQNQYKLLKPTARQSSIELSSSLPIPRVGELNSIEFNFDPRYMIQPVRSNQSQSTSSSHFNPLPSSESSRYSLENYSNLPSTSRTGMNLIRQQSYITAVRSANQHEQPDFVTQFGSPPTSEQEMKQRPQSYILSTDQHLSSTRSGYIPTNFNNQPMTRSTNTYDILPDQKLRNSSQHQAQAIKKLKHFFGENAPLSTEIDHRPSLSQSPLSPPSSSGGRSKSDSIFDGSTLEGTTNPRESIPLTTLTDNLEATKEGILYCKTVLKDGRRAPDRSWRGAWAVLRRGALFLGKEKKHGLLIPLSCDSFPINLQNADVELASDYIKKPRVFKVTTSNQSEFLFQAPDIQSLNEWLDVINDNCLQSDSLQDNNEMKDETKSKLALLPPMVPSTHHEQESLEQRKSNTKSKISLRSPSLKRSPSLRFQMSSLCVESSRLENHCDRLVELKRLVVQLDDYRFETLKYLCAHFRRISSKCDINKIDARNLAIIFGPTLIWDSKASLQSNLVDNPEKIRIVESFILYYEWFFDDNSYEKIPVEINPQMPRLPPIKNHPPVDPETLITNETKPSEIIQNIVRAAKRRWSSPILLENLSSLTTTNSPTTTNNDQQPSKPINISVKRNPFHRCYSSDMLSRNADDDYVNLRSKSTDSALYSMSDKSCRIFKQFYQNILFTKCKTSMNQNFSTPCLHENEKSFSEKTSLLKSKLNQREQILGRYHEQIQQINHHLQIEKKIEQSADRTRIQSLISEIKLSTQEYESLVSKRSMYEASEMMYGGTDRDDDLRTKLTSINTQSKKMLNTIKVNLKMLMDYEDEYNCIHNTTNKFKIIGLASDTSFANIRRTVEKLSGVKSVQVSLVEKEFYVKYDKDKTNTTAIRDAINSIENYQAQLME